MINNINKHPKVIGTTLFSNADEASLYTAKQIADLIIHKQKLNQPAILGLATGNTPKKVYQELVRLHQNEGLSFHNVISFNLDEYYPIKTNHHLSYTYFMHHYLFKYLDVKEENIHIPHTNATAEQIIHFCQDYEKKIEHFGGLDLQLLGIGRNGHIGFNEPNSEFNSNTRLVNLHSLTRKDAAPEFGTLEKVPQQAISMGIQTILQAKKILLLALGTRKSDIMRKALYGKISTDVPASVLQTISHIEYVLDQEAAALL